MLLRKLTILEIDLMIIRFYFNLYLLFQIIRLYLAWTLRCIVRVARRSFEFAASRKISRRFVATMFRIKNPSIVYHPYIRIYIFIDQKWKFFSKTFQRLIVKSFLDHQSFARAHVRSHNLWIALRNFHLSKQLSLRYRLWEPNVCVTSLYYIG